MRPSWILLVYLLKARGRYRGDLAWSLVSALLVALPAILVGYWGEQLGLLDNFAAAAGTGRYAVYLLLGAVYWLYVEAVWSIAFTLRMGMRSGVLEALLVTRLSRLGLIVAWSAARPFVVTLHSVLAIGFVVALAGLPGTAAVGQILGVLGLSVISSYGLAFLLFGLTLRFKDAESLLSLIGNVAPLLGGVFFPVAFLPGFLRVLSYVFPFTYGVDAQRALWLGTSAIFPLSLQLGLLGALAVVYVTLGWWALVYFERRARHHGLEGF